MRDCGAACLAMVAKHYGMSLPITKCRELTKTDKIGTNLYGLVDGAEKIGFKAEALSGGPDELAEGIANGEICFPFVAHTVSEDTMLHYVVVYGVKHGRFQIADPGKGKQRMTPEQFFSCWTGYIVTFEKTAGFQKKNETKGSFSKFFTLLKGQYRKLAAILALSLVISAIGILGSFVFQIVLDDFFSEPYAEESVDIGRKQAHPHPGNAEQEEAELPSAHAQGGHQQGRYHAEEDVFNIGHASTALLVAGNSPRIANVSSRSHQKVGLAGEVSGQKQPAVHSRYSAYTKHSMPM